ncbi:uncharacterized protein CTHT_0017010 [Thermochaetoides thermophila DSM 1495]|uniref:Uncharacterized protein n=1 Tax=Chaetomium thermophilum (strain DSM 1495 / CBS 144.50 / IMI 039719) TaxID=759272 RepID=G0S2F1_CHATD|nr:hypothetical protein CTHT_0017010 [Thermochaetoides thermophila DSM 1495]EGS22184.1 hypothetical protein CTHT_0017010 [Thermochaetoides thermophila DSM 1495]
MTDDATSDPLTPTTDPKYEHHPRPMMDDITEPLNNNNNNNNNNNSHALPADLCESNDGNNDNVLKALQRLSAKLNTNPPNIPFLSIHPEARYDCPQPPSATADLSDKEKDIVTSTSQDVSIAELFHEIKRLEQEVRSYGKKVDSLNFKIELLKQENDTRWERVGMGQKQEEKLAKVGEIAKTCDRNSWSSSNSNSNSDSDSDSGSETTESRTERPVREGLNNINMEMGISKGEDWKREELRKRLEELRGEWVRRKEEEEDKKKKHYISEVNKGRVIISEQVRGVRKKKEWSTRLTVGEPSWELWAEEHVWDARTRGPSQEGDTGMKGSLGELKWCAASAGNGGEEEDVHSRKRKVRFVDEENGHGLLGSKQFDYERTSGEGGQMSGNDVTPSNKDDRAFSEQTHIDIEEHDDAETPEEDQFSREELTALRKENTQLKAEIGDLWVQVCKETEETRQWRDWAQWLEEENARLQEENNQLSLELDEERREGIVDCIVNSLLDLFFGSSSSLDAAQTHEQGQNAGRRTLSLENPGVAEMLRVTVATRTAFQGGIEVGGEWWLRMGPTYQWCVERGVGLLSWAWPKPEGTLQKRHVGYGLEDWSWPGSSMEAVQSLGDEEQEKE